MVELQNELAALEALGVQVVGISYDSVEILHNFSDSSGITFPLLSDVDSQTIREYGIHFQKGLPHPGTYLVDSAGKVRAALFLEGYRARHSVADLIDAVQATSSGE